MARITKAVLVFFMTFGLVSSNLIAEETCYVFVENPGSYESLVVSSIALTMIRQFIDSTVEPIPISGFSDQACMYQVNIIEESAGLKAFILGKNISDYGTSNLRGEPGLEQAILKAIFMGVGDLSKKTDICRKYGKSLEEECKGIAVTEEDTPQLNVKPGSQAAPAGAKTSTYRHPSPAFTIQYPANWQTVNPKQNPRVVFLAREPNRRAPAMEISEAELPKRDLNENNIDRFVIFQWKRRLQQADDFKVLRKERVKLQNGVQGVFCELTFYPDKDKLVTILLSFLKVEKAGKMIAFQIWGPSGAQQTEMAENIISSIRFD
ncbi:hypothetical protein KJ966_28385 [bacterium]|nr:hypothetical protein [bacterium]